MAEPNQELPGSPTNNPTPAVPTNVADTPTPVVVTSDQPPSPAPVENNPQADTPSPVSEEVPQEDDGDPLEISWVAPEFVAHDKTTGWYMALIGVAILVAAGIYWLTKSFVSPGVIIVAAIILAIYGSHKPRDVEYRIDSRGISVGRHTYHYSEFRSFSVVPEMSLSGIVFMPLKRFALPLTLHCQPDDEDKIVQVLGDALPLENHRPDAIDSLMRRIHF